MKIGIKENHLGAGREQDGNKTGTGREQDGRLTRNDKIINDERLGINDEGGRRGRGIRGCAREGGAGGGWEIFPRNHLHYSGESLILPAANL